jgi:hypothetical protein
MLIDVSDVVGCGVAQEEDPKGSNGELLLVYGYFADTLLVLMAVLRLQSVESVGLFVIAWHSYSKGHGDGNRLGA